MKKYAYKNYIGDQDYIFARCVKADEAKASFVANTMVEAKVKTFFDVQGSSASEKPEAIAETIEKAETVLFFLSGKSCESLEFRNNINFALEIKKHIVCIRLDKEELSHGMDMQLANIPMIDLSDSMNISVSNKADKQKLAADIIERFKAEEIITQDTLGSAQEKKNVNLKKQITIIAIIVLASAAFVAGAYKIIIERVAYYQSTEYLLRNVDGSDYLNISQYGNEGIKVLAGKHIHELEFTGNSIDDFSGMKDVSAKIIDVTNCENAAFDEIMQTKNLQTIRVTQKQLKYVYPYRNQDVKIVVVR